MDSGEEQVARARRGGVGGGDQHDAAPVEGTVVDGDAGRSTLEHTPPMSGVVGSRVGRDLGNTISSSG